MNKVIVHNMSDEDFIRLLVNASVIMGSQSAVARALDVSKATLSQIVNGVYKAKLARMKARAVDRLVIHCPVSGEIGIAECQRNRQAAQRGAWPSNPQLTLLYHACCECSVFETRVKKMGGKENGKL